MLFYMYDYEILRECAGRWLMMGGSSMSGTIQLQKRRTRTVSLRSAKYDGSLNYQWPARVLWEGADGFIWHTPAGAPFVRPTGVHPVPYDWIGRVWYQRWYMVDASLLPAQVAGAAGTLHHYYCNLGQPGQWQGTTYHFVDLDLDVLIYPDGSHKIVDEDEFAAHSVRFGYPAEVIAATRQAAVDVVALALAGETPFDGTLAAYHAALAR
jgi:protein associated with RNAse G/E